MAAVDVGGGRPQKAKKGGLRRPKRRIGIRIDMTPMVDIAFLLLIFYMVTTVFSTPLSMEISLPPKESNPDPTPIGESRLLQMWVDKNDSCYYQIGEDMKQPKQVPYETLRQIIDEKNRTIPRLVMLLKLDQKASYNMMVNIIDDIQSAERRIKAGLHQEWERNPSIDTSFSVRFSMVDFSAWDEHILEVVAAGGTVEQ